MSLLLIMLAMQERVMFRLSLMWLLLWLSGNCCLVVVVCVLFVVVAVWPPLLGSCCVACCSLVDVGWLSLFW